MNRKEFLKTGTSLLLGAFIVSSINGCESVRYIIPKFDSNTVIIKRSLIREDESFVLIELKNSTAPLFLGKADDGYIALLLQCTHLGCVVEIFSDKFICPCHGSKFDFKGEVIKSPAIKNLKKFPIQWDNENIIIDLQG